MALVVNFWCTLYTDKLFQNLLSSLKSFYTWFSYDFHVISYLKSQISLWSDFESVWNPFEVTYCDSKSLVCNFKSITKIELGTFAECGGQNKTSALVKVCIYIFSNSFWVKSLFLSLSLSFSLTISLSLSLTLCMDTPGLWNCSIEKKRERDI